MNYINSLLIAVAVFFIMSGCQKKEENVSGYGVNALTISSRSTKIDSVITISIKNNYPGQSSISEVEFKNPLGVLLGTVKLTGDSGSFRISADSLYRFAKMSGANYALTATPRSQIQLENLQFLVKEKPECSRLATLLINPAVTWTPYVIVKDQNGNDSVKYIRDINMQTLQPVYMQYTISSETGGLPQFSVALRRKGSSTTYTNFNYRSFALTDTIAFIGANYALNDEVGFYVKAQNGKYTDSVECLSSSNAAQKLGVWPFNAEVLAQAFTPATPYFNVLTRQLVASAAAGCVQYIAPNKLQAVSSADTTVTIVGYTGDDSYKAYSGNDVWKSYDKYQKGTPASSYTGIAAKNGIVVKTVIRKNGVVVNETWGLFYINSIVTTAGSENVNFNFRNNPKSY